MSDILAVLCLWTAAVAAHSILSLDKWLVLLPGMCVSFILGFALTSPEDPAKAPAPQRMSPKEGLPARKRIWNAWTSFSIRAGGFQSRMLISYIFFIFILPFALIVRFFSDPLHLKTDKKETHWQERKTVSSQLEDYRRQF